MFPRSFPAMAWSVTSTTPPSGNQTPNIQTLSTPHSGPPRKTKAGIRRHSTVYWTAAFIVPCTGVPGAVVKVM